ncbi:hypothetical protein KHA90_23235 [Flavobacterium psychroterrae]|uniref:Uncharacterized protein n=1 Tax=Flavobacterium psychroterrae TaxID=2133767 RepID=A0ABS5PK59_9FLAO|nr:hypothetical protein [Flavobacterium psychroterrae]MBS7233931.1 hypothetical protein [Flavobacterium psychroterrae]
MKKNEISFGTNFWSGFETGDPFYALETFFDFAHLDYYKNILSEVVMYSYKRKIYKQDNPCEIFIFYTAVCSFIKVCYCLQKKSKKWKVNETADFEFIVHLASLTKEEYSNPFIVFQKAFAEITKEQYEFYVCDMVHLSLSPCAEEPNYDVMTPYIHLIKMLDASQLMRERGFKKVKNNQQT